MPGPEALCLTIHEPKLKRLRLVEARKPEADHRATLGKTRLMMNVCRMLGLFRGAGDLEDAFIQICHLHVRYAIRRGAVPAVADGFSEVAVLFTLEGVMEDERAFFAQPGGVVLR